MFDQDTVQKVWEKAAIVPNVDPSHIRKDACGAWIIRSHYGARDSDYGWEIDHVYPEALGGDDNIDNLRALQWENNTAKSDDYPVYQASVRADGAENKHIVSQYTVNAALRIRLRELYHIAE